MQLARFNAALGTAGSLKAQLENDCLTLETKITGTLKARLALHRMRQLSNALRLHDHRELCIVGLHAARSALQQLKDGLVTLMQPGSLVSPRPMASCCHRN